MKKSFALFILASSLLLLPSSLFAQQPSTGSTAPSAGSAQTGTDQDVKLLREDLRSQKKQIIAANMQLTDAEAQKFWPVYDAYTKETTKLGDMRYALIKDYAQSYNSLTDAQADSFLKRLNDLDESTVRLRQQWTPKFRAVLNGKQTALFFQLDRRVGLLIDLQLASMIPLVNQ